MRNEKKIKCIIEKLEEISNELEEIKDDEQSILNNLPRDYHGLSDMRVAEHNTFLLQEGRHEIGCAMLRFKDIVS